MHILQLFECQPKEEVGKENTVSLLEKIVLEIAVVDFIGAVGSLAFRKVISVKIL